MARRIQNRKQMSNHSMEGRVVRKMREERVERKGGQLNNNTVQYITCTGMEMMRVRDKEIEVRAPPIFLAFAGSAKPARAKTAPQQGAGHGVPPCTESAASRLLCSFPLNLRISAWEWTTSTPLQLRRPLSVIFLALSRRSPRSVRILSCCWCQSLTVIAFLPDPASGSGSW